MAYYGGGLSKEQREAVAPALKELNRILELKKSNSISAQNEITRMIFKGNVPRISSKPIPADYGLPDDIEIKLVEEKDLREAQCNKKVKSIKLRLAIILSLLSIAIIALLWLNTHEPSMFILVPVLIVIVVGVTNTVAENKGKALKNTKSKYEDDYKRYLDDKRAYEYWKNVDSLKYWDALDGHAFEKEVASVYQGMGYEVTISKAGGDGGIDLLLRKGIETVAVQCKAHNKPVAPAVARDLYGTMVSNGISKGIIVSKNGFTKGVSEFTANKDIELVDLDMLMKMQKDSIA